MEVQGTASTYPRSLYDAVHGKRSIDERFYAAVARGAEHVLELGCGTGRIASVLTREGAQVTGIDLSVDAIAEARRAAPAATFEVADMRDFDLGRTFDRIICPYNGMYCLLSEADLRATFAAVRRHLAPGGLFVFDGYAADHFHAHGDADQADEDDSPVLQVQALGQNWKVFERSVWKRAEQRIDAQYEHRPVDGGDSLLGAIPQRYLLRAQIDSLVEQAGLTLVVVHGDFDQSVWSEDAPYLIVTAMAPLAEA